VWYGVAEKLFVNDPTMGVQSMLEVNFFYPDPDHTLDGPRVLSGNQMIDFCKIQCFLSGFGSHPGGRPQILSGRTYTEIFRGPTVPDDRHVIKLSR